jgi:hypothetical protein
VELVLGLLVLGQVDHHVLEGEEDARLHLEGEVEVDGPPTALLGVEVHLPHLAQRVRLDEVTLVVHVETVVDGVILQLGDEAGDIDGGQATSVGQRARVVAASGDLWPRVNG